MVKKALCVGINDYPQSGMALRGCVNDAEAWASLLRDQYEFAADDVTVLLDADARHSAILAGLKSLLRGASKGDVLVFTNASHGTYLADANGDEPTYDEAMCPYDTAENPLVDDELRELFADVPNGVRLTVVSDSCHSGSVTRLLDDERRPRFMSPRLLGRPVLDDPRSATRRKELFPASEMREVLLSGCKANQYSMDAVFGGTPHGAFTYHALAAIRARDYRISYADLHQAVLSSLTAENYDQEPQAEGSEANLRRQIFT